MKELIGTAVLVCTLFAGTKSLIPPQGNRDIPIYHRMVKKLAPNPDRTFTFRAMVPQFLDVKLFGLPRVKQKPISRR